VKKFVKKILAKKKDDDNDQNPPTATGGGDGKKTKGPHSLKRRPPKFEMQDNQANRPFYPRAVAIQKLFYQLLQFIFFTPDGSDLRVAYRLPLQVFSMIFSAPLLIIRLVLAVVANQSLEQPIKIDSNHPQLQRLLRENNLPDQLSVAYLTREGLQLPTISIQPLSALNSNSLANWYGNYVSAGEKISGQVQKHDTLYLPDSLLATVVEGAGNYPAYSWQGAWKTANYTGARALLSLFIGHIRNNRDGLLRVDLLIAALDQPLAQPWSKQISAPVSWLINGMRWLPKTMIQPMHQQLRKINSPSYLQMILKGQQSSLAKAISQGHHPLGKAYRLWSAMPVWQTQTHFVEQLDQYIEDQWEALDQKLAKPGNSAELELIALLETLSDLVEATSELQGIEVGKWKNTSAPRAGQPIYLPASILGDRPSDQSRVLERLQSLPAIKVDEDLFERYRRDNRRQQHDIAA